MPQLILRPDAIYDNINEGWASPEHIDEIMEKAQTYKK